MLKGDFLESNTDGAILYQYLETNLQRAKVAPEVKKARVLNQFTLIKDRPQLNTKREDLGNKTPLKFFAEYINENIFKACLLYTSLVQKFNEDASSLLPSGRQPITRFSESVSYTHLDVYKRQMHILLLRKISGSP